MTQRHDLLSWKVQTQKGPDRLGSSWGIRVRLVDATDAAGSGGGRRWFHGPDSNYELPLEDWRESWRKCQHSAILLRKSNYGCRRRVKSTVSTLTGVGIWGLLQNSKDGVCLVTGPQTVSCKGMGGTPCIHVYLPSNIFLPHVSNGMCPDWKGFFRGDSLPHIKTTDRDHHYYSTETAT